MGVIIAILRIDGKTFSLKQRLISLVSGAMITFLTYFIRFTFMPNISRLVLFFRLFIISLISLKVTSAKSKLVGGL